MGYLNVPYQQHNTPIVYQTNADEHKTPKQSILASQPAGQQVYTPRSTRLDSNLNNINNPLHKRIHDRLTLDLPPAVAPHIPDPIP